MLVKMLTMVMFMLMKCVAFLVARVFADFCRSIATISVVAALFVMMVMFVIIPTSIAGSILMEHFAVAPLSSCFSCLVVDSRRC